VSSAGGNSTEVGTEELRARTRALFDDISADLAALIRIPSVSAPSFDPQEVDRSAAAVAELLRGAGMSDVEVLRSPQEGEAGAPAVIGHRPGPPGAPTVLLYAHHDVQPPGDAAQWTTPAFAPDVRGGRMFGRGSADDKAGIMAHVGALRVLGDELPVSVTVFIEGEEEIGSPTFASFLRAHRDRLAADVIVVADSSNWAVGTPALTTSLRGLVDCIVEVTVATSASHSGIFGGPVLDAHTVLSRLIATLHDGNGDVAVAGLSRGAGSDVVYPESEFREQAATVASLELAGTGSLAERLWLAPAINVIGIDATPISAAANNIVPSARAKLSLRVAPGQDPAAAEQALFDHLRSHVPLGARMRIVPGERGQAFLADTHGSASRAARRALEAAWGREPVEIGMGGSIPFIADLAAEFPHAQILITAVADPQSRTHAADESVDMGDLEKAVLAEALLLRLLAAG